MFTRSCLNNISRQKKVIAFQGLMKQKTRTCLSIVFRWSQSPPAKDSGARFTDGLFGYMRISENVLNNVCIQVDIPITL